MENNNFEVVIIGGSYAGLSAAMALGRAIRKVLIIDGGKPCNQQTPHSHNFLTQDGNTPAEITRLGREQVLAYPTVQLVDDEVTSVQGENLQFRIETISGKRIQAKKVIFATGIKDEMPLIAGFAACWGISVIHCPYCHGYEYREERTGLFMNGEMAFEKARLIRNWTKQLTIFTNGSSTIGAVQEEKLATMNINIVEIPLKKIEHKDGYLSRLHFTDDSSIPLTALYAQVPFVQHCQIPASMGCVLTDTGHLQVDNFQKTSIPGVFAAGDNTTMFRGVSMAVGAGTVAGAFINHELITEGY
ncbi:NAD(P)/FAD-dependent oxidoreductase [Olivibacter domesticus]|uniref:Thioredoxin reductase n=1 Tax=Olivibacter domesticus TaxID=407022 RepID=A0A1H7J8A3_OLID1|nr:NAD(P)/FAD-dependent oxidoreductase [Olivibacter domesticus]SEK70220.1 Thioredoxin reductase [Olivibacter domesticus]